MILIADSGSTKCDWMLIEGETHIPTHTIGFNPFFHSTEFIANELRKNAILTDSIASISQIHYYGASCSNDARITLVKNALSAVFTRATEIEVKHDLTGAAIAACGGREGIACILGTGSNSCYYNGREVHEEIPALGYILGDEGSGSYFGKFLLSHLLYKKLPADIAEDFSSVFKLTKDSILFNIYNEPNANVYLASFMRFVSERIDHPFLYQMVFDGLKKFAEVHILCYSNYHSIPVNFVGSIAFHFQAILKQVANDLGFQVGNIIKKPIDGLADFHGNTNEA
jgi:glucosamine kinase